MPPIGIGVLPNSSAVMCVFNLWLLVWVHPLLAIAHAVLVVLFHQCNNKTVDDMKNVEEFIRAAKLGNMHTIREFIRSDGNVNARDEYGNTALIEAVRSHRTEVIKLLLERGANPEIKNDKNLSAFNYAKNNRVRKLLNALAA